jgi:hypothetical protein
VDVAAAELGAHPPILAVAVAEQPMAIALNAPADGVLRMQVLWGIEKAVVPVGAQVTAQLTTLIVALGAQHEYYEVNGC